MAEYTEPNLERELQYLEERERERIHANNNHWLNDCCTHLFSKQAARTGHSSAPPVALSADFKAVQASSCSKREGRLERAHREREYMQTTITG